MKITGTIEVYKIKTVKQITKDSGKIYAEVVGNYDQSEVILPKHLVTNVINNKETYLDDSSDFRQPIRGKVGDVQASSAYARAFVFDDLMVQCQFYMLKMTCEKQDSYLNQLIQAKITNVTYGYF